MTVLFGVDRLALNPPVSLKQGPVGLVTNAAATTADLRTGLEALVEAGIQVAVVFAPEHGFTVGVPAGEKVGHAVEPRTGIPIYSLYGDRFEPPSDVLANLTWIIVDLPDVGVRFYTYESTLVHVLRASAQADVPVLVLDRPNPLNGLQVEGPVLREEYTSFVGMLPVPIRHGMTLGELAWFANDVFAIGARLEVIRVEGWRREMWFDEWGRPWVPPSPNIPHGETALLYAGMCLIEGTNLSEGRGTPYPFAVVGAPWLDGDALARRLNERALPGVRFRPVSFTPCTGKHAGVRCFGVQVHVTQREVFQPVRTGLTVLWEARLQNPDAFAFLKGSGDGQLPYFDRLIGNGHVRPAVESGVPVEAIFAAWEPEERRFRRRRRWYLFTEED